MPTSTARPVRTPAAPSAMTTLSDEELATLSGQGDHDAFGTLMARHRDRIQAICLRTTGNREDALDAVQETLIRAFQGIGRFRGEARFTTWLYRIAANAALVEVERRNRRPRPLGDLAQPDRAVRAGDDGVLARLSLQDALGRIPPEYRVAIVLRELCECGYDEIAAVLDLPLGTVKSRIARGRAALLDILERSPR
jgi:RNA polymerase sigma factor (sigma-70 family)